MKTTHIIMVAIIAIAMVCIAGCTTAPEPTPVAPLPAVFQHNEPAPTPTPSESIVHIETKTTERNKYSWLIVSGKIHNTGNTDVAVFGHVDFYDANDVKFDSCIFSAKPDAHGFATFSATSTDAEDYPSGVTYVVNLEHVYKN